MTVRMTLTERRRVQRELDQLAKPDTPPCRPPPKRWRPFIHPIVVIPCVGPHGRKNMLR